MGARIIRTAASAGALCGWLASCAARASAQEGPGAGGAPGASGSAGDGSAASRLVVKIEDKWHFLYDTGRHYAEETLVEGGLARPVYRCDRAASAPMAVDAGSIGVRKLQVGRTPLSAASSLLDGLRPLAGGWSSGSSQQADEQEVSITNARLQALAGDGAEGGFPTPIVHVRLSQPLPNGTTMAVPRYGEAPASLVVEYDCWRDGRAVIELRLQVLGAGGVSGEACMRWVKICEMGWRYMEISHGSSQAFVSGGVNRNWEELMNTDGTYESVTKFNLISQGIERLRPPTVVSNQKLLKVELRGAFYFGDSDDESFEVTKDPVAVSIVYTCESDGVAEVVMTLEKAVLSEAHRPERTELKWRKVCGATTFRHLHIYLKSDNQKNITQAVSDGAVLQGFMRPCVRKAGGALPPGGALAAHQASCEAGALAFEVPPKERRTTLEVRLDKDSTLEPPSLQPPPDLSYDRRVLQAVLVQTPRSATAGKMSSSNPRKLVQALTVKYTCFKEGVSVVMVTLHVLAHKPIDLAWRKRCVEPKVHVGRAWTAPQAIVITVFVGSIIALVCCLIFYFCGQDDRSLGYEGVPNGAGGARDVEMSGQGPGPSRLGVDSEKWEEEEVTFHN